MPQGIILHNITARHNQNHMEIDNEKKIPTAKFKEIYNIILIRMAECAFMRLKLNFICFILVYLSLCIFCTAFGLCCRCIGCCCRRGCRHNRQKKRCYNCGILFENCKCNSIDCAHTNETNNKTAKRSVQRDKSKIYV